MERACLSSNLVSTTASCGLGPALEALHGPSTTAENGWWAADHRQIAADASGMRYDRFGPKIVVRIQGYRRPEWPTFLPLPFSPEDIRIDLPG